MAAPNVDRLRVFTQVMAKLGVAFDKSLDQPQIDLYWDSLQDIPETILSKATDKWILEHSRFPRIADLRESCNTVKPERSLPPPPDVDGEPTYHCPLCKDAEGAWEPFKKWSHLYQREVEYVRRCSCYQSNPVHVARRDGWRTFHPGGDDHRGRKRDRYD